MKILNLIDSEYPLSHAFRSNEILLKYYIDNSLHDNRVVSQSTNYSTINNKLYKGFTGLSDIKDFDVLLFHDYKSSWFDWVIENNIQKPMFFVITKSTRFYPFRGKQRNLKNGENVRFLIGKGLLKFIAVSKAACISFKEFFPESQVEIIPAPADQDLYNTIEFEKSNIVKSKTVVGFAGRPTIANGTPIFLEVLKRFENDNPNDIGFLVALSGSKNNRYDFVEDVSIYCPNLVISGKFKFLTDICKLKIPPEFLLEAEHSLFVNAIGQEVFDHSTCAQFADIPLQKNIDIYFNPALINISRLSIIEALMSGVPVVSSDTGMAAEIINSNNGALVSISDKFDVENISDSDIDMISKLYYEALNKAAENNWVKKSIAASVSKRTASEYSRRIDQLLSSAVNNFDGDT